MSIPTQTENPKGLHQRYFIFKKKGNCLQIVPDNEELFVLRLDEWSKDKRHIEACRIAINAYANAIENFRPDLAADIRNKWPELIEWRGEDEEDAKARESFVKEKDFPESDPDAPSTSEDYWPRPNIGKDSPYS